MLTKFKFMNSFDRYKRIIILHTKGTCTMNMGANCNIVLSQKAYTHDEHGCQLQHCVVTKGMYEHRYQLQHCVVTKGMYEHRYQLQHCVVTKGMYTR